MEPDLPQHDLIAAFVNAHLYSSATFVPTGKNSPRVSKASLIFLLKKCLKSKNVFMSWYLV
jgi:hypothetical protein